MGGVQPEDTGANATESKDQGAEGDAQTTRAELTASLQVRSLLHVAMILKFLFRNQGFPPGYCLGVM